jgi:type I restriction enzyme S subunit
MTGWPLVELHQLARPIERAETPEMGKIYRQIGVKWWGEGAYERERIDGGSTRYPKFFQVNSGDLVINKIWTRHGSVCIIPDELSGCYVSNEFPVFTLNAERVDIRWLHWLTKTRWLWEECAKRSQGTSGKNRIRPEEFLRIPVP